MSKKFVLISKCLNDYHHCWLNELLYRVVFKLLKQFTQTQIFLLRDKMPKESNLEQSAIRRREYDAKRDLLASSLKDDENDPVKAQNGHLRRENIAKNTLCEDYKSYKLEHPAHRNYGEVCAKKALLESCLDSDNNVADRASSFQLENCTAEILKRENEAKRALLHPNIGLNSHEYKTRYRFSRK